MTVETWWLYLGAIVLIACTPGPNVLYVTTRSIRFGLRASAVAMAGCLLAYVVGQRGSEAARRFIGEEGIAKASALVQRYGDMALVLCRPVPVLAEASVVFAGLVRSDYGRFLRLTATSNLGIAAGYAAVGAFSRSLDSYSFFIAFIGALLLPGVFILVSRKTYAR